MRLLFAVLFFFFLLPDLKAQIIYKANTALIGFFSSTPMEDIKAESKEAQSLINTANNEVAVVVSIRSFHFPSALMEEHFNENYLESDKYKLAVFKGVISEKLDFNADFNQEVNATGTLEMHGVKKNILLKGNLVKKGTSLNLKTNFKIALKDYNIQVPKVVGNNIAELIDVKADFSYEPKQK